MSKDESSKKKKSSKGLIVTLVGGLVLMGLGGGGAYALLASGMVDSGHAEKETNEPKLVLKGEEDPYTPKTEGKEAKGPLEVPGEGGSKYRTTYFNFSDEFTSNLKNSSALVQIGLTASTRRDGRVIMWMQKHEIAIRSQILAVLADTPEEDAFTMEGKERLQKRLTAAINNVLIEAEGFGGVDAVYFKSFLVQ